MLQKAAREFGGEVLPHEFDDADPHAVASHQLVQNAEPFERSCGARVRDEAPAGRKHDGRMQLRSRRREDESHPAGTAVEEDRQMVDPRL